MTTEDTTGTQTAPPPPRPYPPIHELRRSRTDRKVAGVAGGLGRYANVDPLIFRILFVVLTVFGGSGILLYALAWLFVAADGEQESEGQRLFGGRSNHSVSTVIALVVVLVVGLVVTGAAIDTGPGVGGLGVLVVVAVVTVLLLRNGQRPATNQAPPAPAYGPVPPPEPGTYGQTAGTAYTAPGVVAGAADAPPPPPPPTWATAPMPPVPPAPTPPRERSILGRVTISVALIAVGLMVGWNTVSSGTNDDFRAVAIFGTALAVVAGGLLVGAFMGRARGLILLAIVLAIATSISSAADDHFGGGVGERRWAPATERAAERDFRLGVGDAELDLTRLPAGSDVDVVVRLGVGDLRVVVPTDARVVVDGHVGAGNLDLLDEPEIDGSDLDASTTLDPVGGGRSQITIDARVGLGALEVVR